MLACLAYSLATLDTDLPVNFGIIALFLGLLIAEKFITAFHAHHLIEDFILERKESP